MLPGSEPRRILHGRHENQTIHDENGMRHYYNEWGKWMNRLPSDPEQPYLAPLRCRRRRVTGTPARQAGGPWR